MVPVKPACEACPARTCGVFSDLSREDVRVLARARSANTYRRRSVIFYEGNPSLGMFCVHAGRVKIYNHGPDGHQQIVRLARDGDLLGYRALLAGEPYAATAEVLEEAVICFIDKAPALDLVRRNPGVALRLLAVVSRDLRVAEQRVLDLIQKPVAGRVAGLLLELQRGFGERGPAGVRLDIDLTREELAEMIGTTAESLIRTLSDLRSRGLVALDGHHITLRDPAALARLSAPDG